ncbi:hypothetical protein [Actinoplanes sp. NBRC 103695]|uniref:hypothetical protein n=1 Tax=Actinoplanes sp. NBRC 103695 TaxID=3032202 RepID=UPI00249FD708|nr:hypothetical protein [Actinoplanes sp. NBRC 103695]GLY95383.1 hypothetical protein Acsp02_26380 [Actinoplanes sp. NBRC 103695]
MDATPGNGTESLPTISEYWPDLPHRIAEADYYSEEPTVPFPQVPASGRPTLPLPPIPMQLPPPPRPPRRRKRRGRVVVSALAVVALAAGGTYLYTQRPAAGPPAAAAPSAAAAPQIVTAPLDDRKAAVFVLASNASAVRVRAGDTETDLFRVSSPPGGSVRPETKLSGDTASLTLIATGAPGPEAVDVLLSAEVRWTLRVDAAINSADIDISKAGVDRVELAGDAADILLRLPAPSETLPVQVTGDINRLTLSAGGAAPVRVRARGGAGSAEIEGKLVRGVARNTVFEPGAWRGADDRVDVDVRAGLGRISVENQPG